jgi:lipopolysaccharide/colanic/teichoic acid biosynthesis glycosyltransferase
VDAKRALDVGLVVAAAPIYGMVFGVSALCVLAMDGRPVFFRQERVGRGKRPFSLIKLRTMTLDAEPARRRPTRLGAVLRRHGFDELPQFINVFRGDMSLVGPRPLSRDDTERFLGAEPAFAKRFDVLPGITGLAQVTGARGPRATAAADGDYAERRSIGLDLAILARTVWINVVGKKRGISARQGPT